jgi:3-dehydroquinate synthase
MAAGLKCAIVSEDERESGSREALNYGHTFGHAIERALGYGTVSHGMAVADGMRFAARLAVELDAAPKEWADRQERLLDSLGLLEHGLPCSADALLDAMRSDKKVRGGAVRFVLSTGPGEWVVTPVDPALLARSVARWCAKEA